MEDRLPRKLAAILYADVAGFSRSIEPAITVPTGSVVEVFTHEATGGQFDLDSSVDDLANVNMDMVHTLTGPVFVEGAESGDTLAVELLEIEPGDWAWMAIIPHFGFLANRDTGSGCAAGVAPALPAGQQNPR